MQQTVVTGVGCVTALGRDVRQFWDGLIAGRSGISSIRGFCRDHLRNDCAAEIHLDPAALGQARSQRIATRLELLASLAVEEACLQAALPRDGERRIGLVAGVSLGMSLVPGGLEATWDTEDPAQETADDLSELADRLAQRFSIPGDVQIVSTACASGANAIGIARDMILHDGYDAVICGGADTLDRMKYLGHSALNTLTPTTVRPFAAGRDGTIFGEGAGMLVLESSDNLNGRKPLAVCSGSGASCDAHQITAPDPAGEGAIHAMREALRDSHVEPEEIQYINLHGSGTPHNDEMEYRAIGVVFGAMADAIPASSIKAAIGHTMGAAGACEAVATVLAVLHQKIPPTANTRERDPQLPLHLVCGTAMDRSIEHALSNSFGFGGGNGAVVFSKWRGG